MARNGFIDLLRGYVDSDLDHNGKKFYVSAVTGSSGNASITRLGRFISRLGDVVTRRISYTKSNIY